MSTTPDYPAPTHLVVGGLPIHIYGLSTLSPPRSEQGEGLAILFLLHGRLSSASHRTIPRFAHTLLAHADSQRQAAGGQGKELLVVAFDQRNHGHREVEHERNLGWNEKDGNQRHAVDMVAMQTGTARDVSFLIDFLPSALFPAGERSVTDWYCAGISLGGHATWLAVADDPRLTLGIPIIGSPSSLTLLRDRALNLPPPHGPIGVPSAQFPASLITLLERLDPDRRPAGAWRGKKLLVLSGEEDELVNYEKGGTRAFVERLKSEGEPAVVEVWVQEKTGHACTPEMMHRAADFVWRYGLSRATEEEKAGGGEVEVEGGARGGKL
ncbi:hypothetical protein JCM8097_008384 [Rhodosporidiobolus ruineniae]